MRREDEARALNLAYEYVEQPVNWGREDYQTRAAAQDGFVAGFEAGMAYAREQVPA